MPNSGGSKILRSNSKQISQLPTFYLSATTTLPIGYLFGFLEVRPLSPLGRLEVVCLGLATSGTLTVDRVVTSSFLTGIGGGSDLDPDLDPDSLSNSGGVDFAKFSSKLSNLMDSASGFAFR